MQIAKFYKKHENKILALLAVICMGIFVGWSFDYFYQANDDVYIKNLLSGVYTGTPESHNIQMHFPISLLLSLLYRIAGKLPVYGLFLCICHYGSLYLILERSLQRIKTLPGKVCVALLESLLATALLLPELVFTQYTVTCTMLAGAAAFRFYTTEDSLPFAAFLKANILNIVLVILAFWVRSEMLLLVLPLICVTGFYKWTSQSPVFTKENAKKYLAVFGLILAGIGLSQMLHMLAYSGEDWKTFNRFFNDRTELYDYQFIPSYEEHQEFYDRISLEACEQELLENYNFGLDEDIDSTVLAATAAYAKELKASQHSFGEQFKAAFSDYRYKLFHESDYPWNVAVLALYALLFLLAWKNRKYAYIWKVPLLAFVRSGLWMYIMMGNRYPDRITHSLYFMELVVLGAMVLEQCRTEQEQGTKKEGLLQKWQAYSFTILTAAVLFMVGLQVLPDSTEKVRAESRQREYANREIQALDAYCRKNVENFYFVDVYSAVSCTDYVMSEGAIEYSEKAFAHVDNRVANYDLMGGWVSKSPASDKKYARFGISSIEQGILDRDNVYVIIKTEESMDWLVNYYAQKRSLAVEAELTDTIQVEQKPVYTVYKITAKE